MQRSLDDKIAVLLENRHHLCTESKISSIIQASVPFAKDLANLEESLLRLGNGHTDGIFYAMLLRFSLDKQNLDKTMYQLRYFETGAFQGCMHKNRAELFPVDNWDDYITILPWRVYTEIDIEAVDSMKSKTKGKLL